jgi:P4 family phage/plasmid primase-like protien
MESTKSVINGLIDATTSISYNDDKSLSSLTNKQVMKYIKKGMLGFGLEIESKSNGTEYKKNLIMPNKWNEITEWDMSKHKNGIALLTGFKSNLFVVDIDNIDDWEYLLKETNNIEPQTVKVKTAKGFHLYFKYTDIVSDSPKQIKFNGKTLSIDLKSNGGCIIAPPSKYFNENTKDYTEYTWERSLFKNELLDIPGWLINIIQPIKKVQKEEIKNPSILDIPRLLSMLNEERCHNYNDWIEIGMCLHNIDKKNFTIWDNWSKSSSNYKKDLCVDKWKSFKKEGGNVIKEGTFMRIVKQDNLVEYNKYKREQQEDNVLTQNNRIYNLLIREDLGLGLLFYENVKDTIKIINSNGDGYIFMDTKKLWEFSSRDEIKHKIPQILEPIIEIELGKVIDDKISTKKLTSVLTYVRKSYGVANIYTNMYVMLLDKKFEKKLNKLADYLPIKNNKKICLKNGIISDRTETDYFSYECDVEYVKERKHIKKFMKSVFVHEDKINYVQKIYGYCLTGRTHERCLFIEYGNGRNGKGIINKLLEKILGLDKFYVQTTKDVFIKNNNPNNASPHLYALMHKRVGVFSESSKMDKMNDTELKALTGDDPITCRKLFGDLITFTPVCKLIIQTNNKLEFDLYDQASVDRYKYIYFDQRFVNIPKNKNEHKADQKFVDSLKNEYLDECFSYFVDGAIEWYKTGLKIPECVVQETNNYIQDIDILYNFINSRIKTKEKHNIKCTDVYKNFMIYCMEYDDQMKVMKKPEFKTILQNKYNFEICTHKKVEYYINIICEQNNEQDA